MSSDINDGYELLKPEQEPKRGEGMFIDEARQLAAQCWCDDETKDRVMDPALCEAVAKRISAWMDTAAQYARNQEFYRGIVCKIGETFGVAAKTSDDGSIQQDILALKVPELVADHAAKVAELKTRIEYKEAVATELKGELHKEMNHAADLRKQLAADREKRERLKQIIQAYLDGAQGYRTTLSKVLADDAGDSQ